MSSTTRLQLTVSSVLFAAISAQLLVVSPAAAWDEATYSADISPTLGASFRTMYHCPSTSVLSFDIGSSGYGIIANDSCTVQYSYYVYNLTIPTYAKVENLNVTVPFRDNPGNNSTLVSWAVRHIDERITTQNWSGSRAWFDRVNQTPNWDTFSNRENETREFTAGSELLASFQAAVAAGNSTFLLLLAPLTVTSSPVLYPLPNVTLHLDYDATPPSAPTSLAPVAQAGTVNLSWQAAVDEGVGIGGYQAGWSFSPTMAPLEEASAWLAPSERSWVSSTLPSNVSTYFAVRARDLIGLESNWSAPVHVVIDSIPPPQVQLDPIPPFTALASVSVGWTPVTDPESGVASYEVELVDENGTVRWSTALGANTSSYFLTVPMGLWDMPLLVRVVAVDGGENRGPAGPGVALYVDTLPPAPVELGALPQFTAGPSATLVWTGGGDVGSGTHRFEVEWSVDPLFASVLGFDSTSDVSIVATGLPDGIELHFRVRAIDRVDHASAWANVTTTLDASPPSAPSLNPIPGWMGPNGVILNVSWLPASDAVSGVRHYFVWLEPERFATEQTVAGLEASFVVPNDTLDSVCVVAEDIAGQRSAADCTAFAFDITPPSVVPGSGISVFVGERFGAVRVWGTGTDFEAGLSRVEVRVEDGMWIPADGTSEWSANLTFPLPSDCTGLRVLSGNFSARGIDNVGNFYAVGFTMAFRAYLCPPAIAILEPPEEDEQSHEVLFGISAPSGQGDLSVLALVETEWVELCNSTEPAFPGDEAILLTCDIRTVPDGPVQVKVQMASGNESVPRLIHARQVSLALEVGTPQPTAGTFRVGGSATIAVSVVNNGLGRSGTVTLRFYFVAGTNESLVAETNLAPLGAQERSTTVIINLSLVRAGTFSLKVTASTSGAEQAPTPATTAPFTVAQAPGSGPTALGGDALLLTVALGVAVAAAVAFLLMRRRRQPGV